MLQSAVTSKVKAKGQRQRLKQQVRVKGKRSKS